MSKTPAQLNLLVQPLLAWYDRSARVLPWRSEATAYRVWVSEIMLQQTRVTAVLPYYERFLAELPDVAALASAEPDRLMKLWEGLGYYNRARNLQRAAKIVMEKYGNQFPADYETILSLPGIGEYTAGAIASIAFSQRVCAVDGNVLRVVTRLTGDAGDVLDAAVKKRIRIAVQAVLPIERPGDFNQAMMELGATVCLPNGAPLCEACPAAEFCTAHLTDTTHLLPVKRKKAARRTEKRTVFLLFFADGVALARRRDSGLLAGLTEFPNEAEHLTLAQAKEYLSGRGVTAKNLRVEGTAKHVFTHVEWQMKLIAGECEGTPPPPWRAAEEKELDAAAIPSAFGAARDAAYWTLRRRKGKEK